MPSSFENLKTQDIALTQKLVFKVNKNEMKNIFDEQIELYKDKFEQILNNYAKDVKEKNQDIAKANFYESVENMFQEIPSQI